MNKTTITAFLMKNKVFLIGLFIALFTSIYEISSKSNPSPWILGWSGVIAVLTYLANNLRGQSASIISTILSSAILFFQAHDSPNDLNMKEVTTTVLLPLLIQILALFNTSPPKKREYELSATVEKANAEADEITTDNENLLLTKSTIMASKKAVAQPAENKLTLDNLTQNMRVKLETFNNEGVAISNETKHSDVLSDSDGFKGVASSAPLYKNSIYWTILANGGKKVNWPKDWLNMTVIDLANLIMEAQPKPVV